MRIKIIAALVAVLSAAAALQFSPMANAEDVGPAPSPAGPASASGTVSTSAATPAAPTGISASEPRKGVLKMAWDAVPGAERYNIYDDGDYRETVKEPKFTSSDWKRVSFQVTACVGKDAATKCSSKSDTITWDPYVRDRGPSEYQGLGGERTVGPTGLVGVISLDKCSNTNRVTLKWEKPDFPVDFYLVTEVDKDGNETEINHTYRPSGTSWVYDSSRGAVDVTYQVRAVSLIHGESPDGRRGSFDSVSVPTNRITLKHDLWAGPLCGEADGSMR